ncbi:MAG: hypothetical protein WD341_06065 [Tistlia sp.]|uniref:hypothetical protein n=1 Tax=Tistlia sp. TaxID=3057121 RepID=UPI0034A1D066
MTDYLSQNRLLTAKVETTAGTDAEPTAAANAVACEALRVTPDFAVDQAENEHRSSLDAGEPTSLGGGITLPGFGVRLKGSGTAGTAPEAAPLLRACALAETVTSSAIAGTASAGGARTLTLEDASAVQIGMPITLTGGTSSGDTRTIVAIDGDEVTVDADWTTETDATSAYSIPVNVLYGGASLDLVNATLYHYLNSKVSGLDSILTKVAGAAGNMSLTLQRDQVSLMSFDLRGLLAAAVATATRPTDAAFDPTKPPPFRNAACSLGGVSTRLRTFTLDLANTVEQPDDPTALYGVGPATVTRRQTGGSLALYKEALSTRNVLSQFLDNSERALAIRYGSVAGNRIAITIPRLVYSGNPSDTDIGNYAGESLPFRGLGPDAAAFICHW